MISQASISLLVCIAALSVPEPAKVVTVPEDPDPAYTKVLAERAQKIVDTLGIEDGAAAAQVRDLIADQYRSLSVLHDTRDTHIRAVEALAGGKQGAEPAAEAMQDLTNALQGRLHAQFLRKLSALLTAEQIDKVKDGMTYGLVPITYNGFLEMLPELTAEQKQTILAYLIEAREIAMDAGSSNAKHAVFGKYKGRINNYLSEQGYDLKKASEARNAKNQASQGVGAPAAPRYKIGVCDWMILKRQTLGAFGRTSEIGAQGVEVDMGSLGQRETFDSKLADSAVREQFLNEAKKFNLEICSIAMSGFYAQSFAERPTVPRMIQDCIDTMKAMNVRIAFLPLGVMSDLTKRPELRPAVVERLKAAGALAEKAGVIIGIETSLDAAGEVNLLDEIGSPGIRIYYNFANALQNGRDLCSELETLGPERICQIHCTDEDGVWLENNKRLDMVKVKQTLDKMGWSGWLVLERSRSAERSRDVIYNFGANARYVKSIFQTS
ncbi:MAG: DUF3826 domain-containing protein [Planctomycetaceae bacterium]|nr:DUF3826 domain-containing protein [Planctomycetaceae bacterium]